MKNKSKKTKDIDPIPQEFSSYEEAAEFWDSHDTTDYLDDFEDVVVEKAELHNRIFEVEIDEDVAVALSQQAKKEGVSIKSLVSQLLRQQLPPAA
jgi:predicted HicB family RNase H-like nuclease